MNNDKNSRWNRFVHDIILVFEQLRVTCVSKLNLLVLELDWYLWYYFQFVARFMWNNLVVKSRENFITHVVDSRTKIFFNKKKNNMFK